MLWLSSSLLFSSQSLDKIFNKASIDNKIVIIKATSKNCHYCKKMDKTVLSDNDVIKALDKDFILISIDVTKDNLPFGLKSTMTPTFFFLDAHKGLIKEVAGAWHKEDFLIILKEIKILYNKNHKD